MPDRGFLLRTGFLACDKIHSDAIGGRRSAALGPSVVPRRGHRLARESGRLLAHHVRHSLLMVRPNRLLGWQLSRSHRFDESTDILIDVQVHLELGELQNARYCLEQVIRNLPGTSAEPEARRLLATLKQR